MRWAARAILGESVLRERVVNVTEPFGDYLIREFISKWLNHERITPAIAPHAPYTNKQMNIFKKKPLVSP